MWDKIEPTEGTYDWSTTDAVVAELQSAGIEPLFVVVGSPTWANGADPNDPNAAYVIPTSGPAFERWLAEFQSFVALAASRYGDRVHFWEVWNEENERATWRPQPNVDLYARTYTAARSAILASAPTAKVAVGGLDSYCCVKTDGSVPGGVFLSGLLASHIQIDNIAIHPYATANQAPDSTLTDENNFTDIGAFRSLELASGVNAPIWITEWGWPSSAIGAQLQAEYLEKSLEMIRDQFPYVVMAIYFLDHDRTEYSQGLYDLSMRPKPAAAVFASFAAGTSASSSPSSSGTTSSPQPTSGTGQATTSATRVAASLTAGDPQPATRSSGRLTAQGLGRARIAVRITNAGKPSVGVRLRVRVNRRPKATEIDDIRWQSRKRERSGFSRWRVVAEGKRSLLVRRSFQGLQLRVSVLFVDRGSRFSVVSSPTNTVRSSRPVP